MSEKVKVQVWVNKNFPTSMLLAENYDLDDFEFQVEFNMNFNIMAVDKDYIQYAFDILNNYDQMYMNRSLSVRDLVVINLRRYLITNFGIKEV